MCPGEIPTPGLTGADHIRFVVALGGRAGGVLKLPAGCVRRTPGKRVEHRQVFVLAATRLQASIGHQPQVVGDLFIHEVVRECAMVADASFP